MNSSQNLFVVIDVLWDKSLKYFYISFCFYSRDRDFFDRYLGSKMAFAEES